MSRRHRTDDGQATAELALLVPVLLVIVLLVGQMVLVWRGQLLVTQAAQEAARVGVVSSDVTAMTEAARGATGLDPSRISVQVLKRDAPGGLVTVRVSYHPVDQLPIVGIAVRAMTVSATATMLVES